MTDVWEMVWTVGRRNGRLQARWVTTRNCQYCGTPFSASRASVKAGHGRFCGKRCERNMASEPLDVRLLRNVKKTDGCWLWTGYTSTFGYGMMRFMGKSQNAHRLSWQVHRGPIPDGLSVLHKCDVPACVNPDHLFLGTQSDNMKDCASKGRLNFVRDKAQLALRARERSAIRGMQAI